ncbi:MAG: hypothetical protein JNM84_03880 [Planctomycetes bacterium]|nr:hypothetical protein [Planctomycetota bacterium]
MSLRPAPRLGSPYARHAFSSACANARALALLLAFAWPSVANASPQDRGDASKIARRAARIADARARGSARAGDMLTKLPPEELASARALRGLRAWLESGGAANAIGVDRVVEAQRAVASSADVEEAVERLELARLVGSSIAELRTRANDLLSRQAEDGAFPASRQIEKDLRVDDAALTARALWALKGGLGPQLEAAVEQRALDYLLRAQRADGGVGASGASNGAATAASAAIWMRCAASTPDSARREKLLRAIDRAERWLRASDRFDQNPGARADAFAWLVDHARATKILLWPADPTRSASHDRDLFLAEFQLLDAGWNRSASMNDVMGGGGMPTAAGQRGVAIQIAFDFDDTASAVLALHARVLPTPAELELALRRRLGAASALPPSASWDELAEMLRLQQKVAVPILLEQLEHQEQLIRRCADHLLRAITGEDFGFVPNRRRDDARNAEALRAWREWWKK